jgi:hypothetical protein
MVPRTFVEDAADDERSIVVVRHDRREESVDPSRIDERRSRRRRSAMAHGVILLHCAARRFPRSPGRPGSAGRPGVVDSLALDIRALTRASWQGVIALLVASGAAEAAPRRTIADVCEGCLATASDDTGPAPLLVTLHGDWGHLAPDLHRAWERFVAPRGVALLSLACPTKLGCKNSWWQWNGEPSWIVEQVDRLAAIRAIDRDRLWIAGWSGGATYIGMRTPELERTFAGIVIHGGGHWPWPDDCPAQKARVVFLVGDRNPFHKNVLALRDHYARCGNDLTFHVLAGAEHDAEWKALGERGAAIMDVLGTTRMTRSPPTVVATASAVPVASSPAPPVQMRPAAGCGCDVGAPPEISLAVMLPGLLLLVRTRRRAFR